MFPLLTYFGAITFIMVQAIRNKKTRVFLAFGGEQKQANKNFASFTSIIMTKQNV